MSDPDLSGSGPSPSASEWSGPPWTDQPAQMGPSRRSRGRFVVAVVVTAALVLLIVALARWLGLGPTLLHAGEVQRDVAAQFEERHELAVEIECPRRMEVASGEVYTCNGATEDGDEVTIEIRIADSLDGAYTWAEV